MFNCIASCSTRSLTRGSVTMWQRWSDFLASLAIKWAARCNFSHGHPPLGDDPPYLAIGQNLYAATAGQGVNLTAGIQAWYNEKADYDYNTTQCADKKVCGHYTQVGLQHLKPYRRYYQHYYYHHHHHHNDNDHHHHRQIGRTNSVAKVDYNKVKNDSLCKLRVSVSMSTINNSLASIIKNKS